MIMEGGEDDCDFETLAAMLDDDDASSTRKDAPLTPTSQNGLPIEESGTDDDDDDIDDDELDKLAAMVANEDTSAEGSKQDSQQTLVAPALLPSVVTPSATNEIANDVESSEMCKLQERIRELEARLSQQQPETVEPLQSKQPAAISGPSSRLPTQQPCRTSKHPSPSSQQSVAKNAVVRPKIREIGEDIFFAAESSASGKEKKQGVRKSSAGGRPITALPAAHDSDSDWDDLDGEKSSDLSTGGRELNSLLKKGTESQRVAHSQRSTEFTPRPPSTTWKQKPPPTSAGSVVNKTSASASHKDSQDLMTEPFSGLRIIKPLVSSGQMKQRMSGRRLVRVSRLKARGAAADGDDDWVTIGVVVGKSDAKTSSNGKAYSLWKLSDLEDCDQPVSFFLFGECHKTHWKVAVGTVVGVLNATIMPNSDKYRNSSEMSLTIDHPQKVMVLGTSKDFSICRATTKAGRGCSNVINSQKGEYCSYHVQAAYKKLSSKRGELQAGHTGVVPKTFERKLFGRGAGAAVMYGGHSYMTSGHTGQAKKAVSIRSLQKHQAQGPQARVTTLSLQQLVPDDKRTPDQPTAPKEDVFHDLLSTPSAGSVNFVKHLVKTEEKKSSVTAGHVVVQSVNAADLLRAHTAEMKQRQEARRASHQAAPPVAPAPARPQIGRGSAPGGQISFEFDDTLLLRTAKAQRPSARAELVKERAVASLKGDGVITKKDPNAVRSQRSAALEERIRKRALSSDKSEPSAEIASDREGAPPQKKSRLLGDLDLNSAEVQKVLRADSAHSSALSEVAASRQEQYFDVLEKKEQMETKMSSTTEMKCRVVSCKQCGYTAFSASDVCKQAGHTVTSHDAKRRFFLCKNCKRRTTSFFKYPTRKCDGCEGTNFERTSMCKEKKGPVLAKEEFEKNMRGEERKFIS